MDHKLAGQLRNGFLSTHRFKGNLLFFPIIVPYILLPFRPTMDYKCTLLHCPVFGGNYTHKPLNPLSAHFVAQSSQILPHLPGPIKGILVDLLSKNCLLHFNILSHLGVHYIGILYTR